MLVVLLLQVAQLLRRDQFPLESPCFRLSLLELLFLALRRWHLFLLILIICWLFYYKGLTGRLLSLSELI